MSFDLFHIDPGMLRMIVFVAIMILIEVSLALTRYAPDRPSAKTSEMTDSPITDSSDVSQKGTVNKSVKKFSCSETGAVLKMIALNILHNCTLCILQGEKYKLSIDNGYLSDIIKQ